MVCRHTHTHTHLGTQAKSLFVTFTPYTSFASFAYVIT
uniref:Uncharacterized protein n=1 Tax=Anguilla anguilla TaxID=7936 RepID=A0A0E9VBC6_ANGAN